MTDPRFTDPRYSDSRPANPRTADPLIVTPTPVREGGGGVWGWIAGFAVLALIAFAVVAGWNNGSPNTAANMPASTQAPITTGNGAPVRNVTPPSTTGSGASSPMSTPATPSVPSAPAPQH